MRSCLIFRAAGAWGLQRAGKELGPGLWSLSASSSGRPGALLHPVPPRLPECTGLRVDLHIVVTWPVSSMFYHIFFILHHILTLHTHIAVGRWKPQIINLKLKRESTNLVLHFHRVGAAEVAVTWLLVPSPVIFWKTQKVLHTVDHCTHFRRVYSQTFIRRNSYSQRKNTSLRDQQHLPGSIPIKVNEAFQNML